MKKSIKITLTAAIATVTLAGMYAAYTTDGQVNFTDNAVAKTVTSAYKATETAAVNGWQATEDFFVATFFQKDGETLETTKARLQGQQEK